MRGADIIIKNRMRGRKPLVINIFDHPWEHELEPTDIVTDGIPLDKLDLRFVMDCFVTIDSVTQERSDHIEKLCIDNGALQVAGGIYRRFY